MQAPVKEQITMPAGMFGALRRLLGSLTLPMQADQVASLLRDMDACEVTAVATDTQDKQP